MEGNHDGHPGGGVSGKHRRCTSNREKRRAAIQPGRPSSLRGTSISTPAKNLRRPLVRCAEAQCLGDAASVASHLIAKPRTGASHRSGPLKTTLHSLTDLDCVAAPAKARNKEIYLRPDLMRPAVQDFIALQNIKRDKQILAESGDPRA